MTERKLREGRACIEGFLSAVADEGAGVERDGAKFVLVLSQDGGDLRIFQDEGAGDAEHLNMGVGILGFFCVLTALVASEGSERGA